jgi:hypothetical protein
MQMMKKITLSILCATLSVSAFSAQLNVEHHGEGSLNYREILVEDVTEVMEGEDPAPKSAPVKPKFFAARPITFSRGGAGLGFRTQTGTIQANGGNANALFYHWSNDLHPEENYYGKHKKVPTNWIESSFLRGTFNMFNKEVNGPRDLSSGVDLSGNSIIGYTPLKGGEAGLDFFVGASGNMSYSGNFYSNLQYYVAGSASVETGLIAQNDVISTIITGSVSAGGAGCGVTLPNGELYKFGTDAAGFGTQLNLVIGDKLYLNGRYTMYPKLNAPEFKEETDKALEGNVFKGTIAFGLSKKIILTGNCEITNFVNQRAVGETYTGTDGKPATRYKAGTRQEFNRSLVQFGLIRRF